MATAFARLANWVLTHRLVVFCVIFVTLGISILGIERLKIALSPRAFVASDSPEGRGLDRFFAVWGADEDVVIAVADGGESSLLTPERITAMHRAASAVSHIPGVSDSRSLLELAHMLPDADITTVLSSDPAPLRAGGAQQPAQKMPRPNDPLLVPSVLSADGRLSLLLVGLSVNTDDVVKVREVVTQLQQVFRDDEAQSGIDWELTGGPVIRSSLLGIVIDNQRVMIPASMLGVTLLLALLFRRLHMVVLPLIAGIIPLLLLLGLMGWFGEPIGILNQFYFTLIPVIAIANGVHVLARLQREVGHQPGAVDGNAAISRGLAGVGVASTLAALTTMAGFASLGVARMPTLSHFGLYAAVGMGLMLITSIVVLPWGFSFARHPRPLGGRLRAVLTACAKGATDRPFLVLGVFGLLIVGAVLLALRVETDYRLTEDLPADDTAMIGAIKLDQGLTGLFRLQLTLSGDTGVMLRPEVIERLHRLETRWRSMPEVRTVVGPGQMWQVESEGMQSRYALPSEQAGEHALFAQLENTPGYPDVIVPKGNQGRIIVTAPDLGARDMLLLSDRLRDEAQAAVNEFAIHVTATGTPLAVYRAYMGMTSSLLQGFLGMLFVITLCMVITFKSIKLALVSLIPNVVPLLLGFATLAVLGWHLSLVSAMILTLGLGLVVDDTIHLLVNYREQRRMKFGHMESIRRALVGAGEAVVVTSVLLLIGFGVNWASDYPINREFAMVGSTVVLAAVFCDLLLLPALLTVFGAERAREGV